MNLIDILDVYAIKNDVDDLFYMFKDYKLDERLDKDVLNKTIIKELGTMRPITTQSTIFKFRLDTFFEEYEYNISKLIDTMYYDYNPITNKDITETEHRDSTGDIDNTDKYTTNIDNLEESKVSAFDSNNYENKQKDTTDTDTQHEGETTSRIKSDVDTEKHITGKDGEVSIQSLIEQERKLADFNIYKWITNTMRRELFLLVY